MLELFGEGARLLQLSLLAIVVGFPIERLVDTGIRFRGVSLLCGLAGVYAGGWLWGLSSLHPGPRIAGHTVLPALVGTLAVTVVVKLVTLGMAGPRR